jgi:hypothetical protein
MRINHDDDGGGRVMMPAWFRARIPVTMLNHDVVFHVLGMRPTVPKRNAAISAVPDIAA